MARAEGSGTPSGFAVSDRLRTARRLAIAAVAAAVLAGCRGQSPPVNTPDREVVALDAGPASQVPAIPVVAPAPDLGGTPAAPAPAPRAESAGCLSDADCGPGRVCIRCREGPGECIAGCSTSADCPPGSSCIQVECIRCPCPKECIRR